MRFKSTKINQIYLDFIFLNLSMSLRPSWVAKFRQATVLASRLPVVQREDDLPPSWSKLAPVPASLTWQCFQSVLLFLFVFWTVCPSSAQQRCDFRQKKRDKNLPSLIYLLLARLVSLNFSSQTNFKLNSKCKVITATVTVSATAAARMEYLILRTVSLESEGVGASGCKDFGTKWSLFLL